MKKYIDAEEFKDSFIYQADSAYSLWTLTGIVNDIDNMPAADVAEVRHGRWSDNIWVWTCSECGNDASTDWDYCPHCGAKMDIKYRGDK